LVPSFYNFNFLKACALLMIQNAVSHLMLGYLDAIQIYQFSDEYPEDGKTAGR